MVFDADTRPVRVMATNQALTASYVDIGTPLDTRVIRAFGVFSDFTANDSTGVTLRAVAQQEANGDDYEISVGLGTSGEISFTDATDIKRLDTFLVQDSTPFVQLQAKATVVGATAGTLSVNVKMEKQVFR